METIQIKLEKQLLDKALVYAKQRGVDLSAMLSDYLSRLVKQEEKKQEIPDVVQSLLGAGIERQEGVSTIFGRKISMRKVFWDTNVVIDLLDKRYMLQSQF